VQPESKLTKFLAFTGPQISPIGSRQTHREVSDGEPGLGCDLRRAEGLQSRRTTGNLENRSGGRLQRLKEPSCENLMAFRRGRATGILRLYTYRVRMKGPDDFNISTISPLRGVTTREGRGEGHLRPEEWDR